jgi:hypothetical protein
MTSIEQDPMAATRQRLPPITKVSTSTDKMCIYMLARKFKKDTVNLRPVYQRDPRWALEQFNKFLASILFYRETLPIKFYELQSGEEKDMPSHTHECIDGQHRMLTIIHYSESLPLLVSGKKIMIYWFYEDTKTHIFYKENEHTRKWAEEHPQEHIEYMTEEEQERFNDYTFVVQTTTSPMTLEDRTLQFCSLQQGTPVRNSDFYKCFVWIPLIRQITLLWKMEKPYHYFVVSRLTATPKQNWLFCLVRMILMAIYDERRDEFIETTDLKIKSRLKHKERIIMSLSSEQIEMARQKMDAFFELLSFLPTNIKFTPIKMLATYTRFLEDETDLLLKCTVNGWSSKIVAKEESKMWYHAEFIECELGTESRQQTYFRECLAYLRGDVESEREMMSVPQRKPLPKKKRDALWDRGTGSCWTCAKELQNVRRGWEAGHIIAHANGGSDTDLDNFIVQCTKCNREQGVEDAYEFKKIKNPLLL